MSKRELLKDCDYVLNLINYNRNSISANFIGNWGANKFGDSFDIKYAQVILDIFETDGLIIPENGKYKLTTKGVKFLYSKGYIKKYYKEQAIYIATILAPIIALITLIVALNWTTIFKWIKVHF